jgi:hypothetical protein
MASTFTALRAIAQLNFDDTPQAVQPLYEMPQRRGVASHFIVVDGNEK